MDLKGCTELVPAGAIRRTDRIACVDLPAFPLQLLLRDHPDWRGTPAAVVAEDDPQAPLLWVNEAARRAGIRSGMRYVAALALDHGLRAAPVDDRRLGAAGEGLHRLLLRFSPRVEPARHEPGVFWLDAGGLERVGGTPSEWAACLWRRLRRAGFTCGVTVGFSRFGAYCLSRVHRQAAVLDAPARETAACRGVPLERLELPPRLRDDLLRLGLTTVGDLMDLPAAGLAARFGPETAQLVQLARGLRFDPLQPVVPAEPVRAEQLWEEPETDAWRLLFAVKRLLHPLLERLADRSRSVALLHLDLILADRAGTRRRESLRPAQPTLDAVLLLELVRLRLEILDLNAGVDRAALELEDAPASPEALELFRRHPRRDPAAALRALARVRAELGDRAVVRAELAAGHLPEQTSRWAPVDRLDTPQPAPPRRAPLVRRLLPRPRPLRDGPPDLARTHPELLLRAAAGPVTGAGRGAAPQPQTRAAGPGPRSPDDYGRTDDAPRLHGPHLLSSGWWDREQRRAYHFLESGDGQVLWIFYDEREQRWYLQGRVE